MIHKFNPTSSQMSNTAALLLPVFLMYGCCSTDVKPGEANLFQAACGVTSGQYEEDLETSEKEAEASRKALHTEKIRSGELESDLTISKARLHKMQMDLADLEKENAGISQQIASLKNETDKDKALKKQYSDQLQRLNLDIDDLKQKLAEKPDTSQLDQLEKLKQEVDTLRMIVLEQ